MPAHVQANPATIRRLVTWLDRCVQQLDLTAHDATDRRHVADVATLADDLRAGLPQPKVRR